ncbi:hypothetical protein F5Y16DRAFT_392921 [Xylariaceae sp. FL0255]|nr:hypothetical protein F5Y16DRAFT_392921 [Xylariaceae sp. FL0255]
MADDNHASTSITSGRTSSPSALPLRRAATIGNPPQARRRLNGVSNPPPPSSENTFAGLRRRSSTYSDFLETSADEILNPSKSKEQGDITKSPFVYVPLILALLPAVAGILFENGAAFFTDLTLLSIAAIFLHWSVTQPWDWYHTAQQIRIDESELLTDSVFESDSDQDQESSSMPTTALENVPEENGKENGTDIEPGTPKREAPARNNRKWEERQAAAVKELHMQEMIALAWCFAFPMLAAYLLHTIRGQLTRPSEGLVSDYNLTIFICAAEIRPVSHLFRMIHTRTLHIQKIVARNPYPKELTTSTSESIQALKDRLEELEERSSHMKPTISNDSTPEISQKVVETAVGREFRRSVQPELESLSRAMRRYEKKLTLLASQTDNRIEYVDYRLNDAIALAAVAAKNSNPQWPITGWLFGRTVAVVTFPFHVIGAIVTFPFRTASTLFVRKSRAPGERGQRSSRMGKVPSQGRNGTQGRNGSADRLPARLSRR